jgi:hypothetical protein
MDNMTALQELFAWIGTFNNEPINPGELKTKIESLFARDRETHIEMFLSTGSITDEDDTKLLFKDEFPTHPANDLD